MRMRQNIIQRGNTDENTNTNFKINRVFHHMNEKYGLNKQRNAVLNKEDNLQENYLIMDTMNSDCPTRNLSPSIRVTSVVTSSLHTNNKIKNSYSFT